MQIRKIVTRKDLRPYPRQQYHNPKPLGYAVGDDDLAVITRPVTFHRIRSISWSAKMAGVKYLRYRDLASSMVE